MRNVKKCWKLAFSLSVSPDLVAQLYLNCFFPKNSQLVCAVIWDFSEMFQRCDKGLV